MPDTAVTDGVTVLNSSLWDSMVRQQVTVTCTSGTRPTNVEGRLIYETDTDRLLLGTGSGSNWIVKAEPSQTWAPSFSSGVTVGNGAWSGAITHRSDGWVDLEGVFTLGSTSAISGDILLTLPYTAASKGYGSRFRGAFYDTSGGSTVPIIGAFTNATTSVWLRSSLASGTPTVATAASATVPFTWATGDSIEVVARYPMANRYG